MPERGIKETRKRKKNETNFMIFTIFTLFYDTNFILKNEIFSVRLQRIKINILNFSVQT